MLSALVRDFKRFLQESRRGNRFLYHVGSLLADRERDGELDKLANLVWAAYKAGLVELTQRIGDGDGTHYVATRTSYRP